MANRQWYTAIGGQQAGPYSDQRLGEMIASGMVRADTFVWCNGMTDWAAAGDVPGLMPRARPAPPPPPRPGPPQAPRGPAAPAQRRAPAQAAAAQRPGQNFGQNFGQTFGQAGGENVGQSFGQAFSAQVPADAEALTTTIGMWPLLGRGLLVVLAQITIVATPWAMTAFYKWFIESIVLPGQQRAGFAGKPMDIWYIFMLYAFVAIYSGYIFEYLFLFLPFFYVFWELSTYLLLLIKLAIIVFLLLIIIKWVVQNTVWEGQSGPLTFTGSYLAMLGWYVFTAISFITIVGWAWVAAAWIRWMCHHLEGGNRQLVFTAGGWDILWRTWLFAISCVFIIPIPWTLHWITTWYVSQFALSHERTPA
ncbi:MAG: DUF4339 domain-containing protein [Xanthobacteraceae bacterium]